MDSAVIPFDAFSKTQRCSPPEAPIRIVGRYPSCVPPQSLFVQILDHCMAEAMKSLGTRLTMLTTHSYRTAIARKPVRQDGNRTLRWHGSRRLLFPVNQEKARLRWIWQISSSRIPEYSAINGAQKRDVMSSVA